MWRRHIVMFLMICAVVTSMVVAMASQTRIEYTDSFRDSYSKTLKDENEDPFSPNIGNSFSIYIVEDEIYGNSEVQIGKLNLSKRPILTSSQIAAYDWNEHEITYSESTYGELLEYTDLWRKGFVVAVGNERIYWGLFQSYLDSYGCLNPVIFLTLRFPGGTHVLPPSIVIQRSYFNGEGLENEPDPRSDLRIYESLRDAGILTVNTLGRSTWGAIKAQF